MRATNSLRSAVTKIFAAWAGTDVEHAGSTMGRAAADASYRARSAIQGAQGRFADVQEQLHEVQEKVSRRLPWRRDER